METIGDNWRQLHSLCAHVRPAMLLALALAPLWLNGGRAGAVTFGEGKETLLIIGHILFYQNKYSG